MTTLLRKREELQNKLNACVVNEQTIAEIDIEVANYREMLLADVEEEVEAAAKKINNQIELLNEMIEEEATTAVSCGENPTVEVEE